MGGGVSCGLERIEGRFWIGCTLYTMETSFVSRDVKAGYINANTTCFPSSHRVPESFADSSESRSGLEHIHFQVYWKALKPYLLPDNEDVATCQFRSNSSLLHYLVKFPSPPGTQSHLSCILWSAKASPDKPPSTPTDTATSLQVFMTALDTYTIQRYPARWLNSRCAPRRLSLKQIGCFSPFSLLPRLPIPTSCVKLKVILDS